MNGEDQKMQMVAPEDAKMQETPQEKAQREYKEYVARVQAMEPEEVLEHLEPCHRSDVYRVIRDIVTPLQQKLLNKELATKKRWNVLVQESKQSWDHDHKTAMMMDVDRACTMVYQTVLKLIKAGNEDTAIALGKVMLAINRIEEKLGYEPTTWEDSEPDPSATAEPVNEPIGEATDATESAEGDTDANP